MAPTGWLLALVLLLSARVAVAQSNGADQELYRLVAEVCINNSAALPTSFQTSVQTVLDSLSNKAASSLYNQANASLDGSHVYGAAQCRGDLSTANCSACINQMLDSSSTCSADHALGRTLISKGCYLRYDNSSDFLFPSTSAQYFGGGMVSTCTRTGSNTANDAAFSANVASALAEVVAAAPSSQGFFSAASKGSGGGAANALAQCDGFLSASLCADCLSAAIAQVNASCNAANSTSFDLFYGPCSLYYDHEHDSTPADAPVLLPTSYEHHPSPSPSSLPSPSDANHHARSHINLLLILLAVVPLVSDYSF